MVVVTGLALAVSCDRPTANAPAATDVTVTPSLGAKAATVPDIVLILTDDMRHELLQFMPAMRTRMMDSGVKFSKAFVNSPLCCPSRVSFLTGTLQHTHLVRGNAAPLGGALAFNDAQTIATDLQAVGYTTGYIGKYLNAYEKKGANYVPPGWMEWRAFWGPQYFNFKLVEKAWDSTAKSTKLYMAGQYSTTTLRNKATNFIRRAPPGAPIFLVIAPYAPHYVVVVGQKSIPPPPAPQDVGVCDGIVLPARPPSFDEADVSDKPQYIKALPRITRAAQLGADSARRAQCAALRSVDRLVAAVIDSLAVHRGIANTLIVFATDNGYFFGEHRLMERKSAPYDEATRTPLVIRGLGARMHVVDTNLVQLVDVSATFRAVAGLPTGATGRDLRPTLATGQWTTDALLFENVVPQAARESFSGAVRTHDWLYVESPAAGPGGSAFTELYDLRTDRFQLVNRAADPLLSPVVSALHARLLQLQLTP